MLNPVSFTQKVVANFLRYQLTSYPFADSALCEQLRQQLSFQKTRQTPLLNGPYVSLSRAFSEGAAVASLVDEGVFHPHMRHLVPFPAVRALQEEAIRAIGGGQNCVISTGTGSGKTEAFLYPIISRCVLCRDERAPAGILAVLVYPMNALAEDQLQRLRELLAGSGVTFGMYVGKTPEREVDVTGDRLPPGSSKADFEAAVAKAKAENRRVAVHPPEERCSREAMRRPGEQPRILLTNVKMLEYLLTREKDVELFDDASLEFLVFDEAHTFSGSLGAETAALIRRLRTFCGRSPEETVCVATSATIADPANPEAARDFASRFFGVEKDTIAMVGERYAPDLWKEARTAPHIEGDVGALLQQLLSVIESDDSVELVSHIHDELTGEPLNSLDSDACRQDLYDKLSGNEIVFQLAKHLDRPMELTRLSETLGETLGRPISEEEILIWLTLGAASRSADDRPLLRPVMHNFIRGIGGAGVTFPLEGESPLLSLSIGGEEGSEFKRLDLTSCTTCGQHYFVHYVADLTVGPNGLQGGEAVDDHRVWKSNVEALGGKRVVLVDHVVSGAEENDGEDEAPPRTTEVFFCRRCGALHDVDGDVCDGCGTSDPKVRLFAIEQKSDFPEYLTRCLSCASPGRPWGSLYREPARPVRAVDVSDIHVLAQDMIQQSERKRLLLFADNRQDAAFQAGWMRDHARRFRLRSLMAEKIAEGAISIGDLTHHLDDVLEGDEEFSKVLVPEVWAEFPREHEGLRHAQVRKQFLRIQVLREISTGHKQRVGLEPWGRIAVEYSGLTDALPIVEKWSRKLGVPPERLRDGIGSILDYLRRSRLDYDSETEIYTRIRDEGDREVQRGYVPRMPDVPKGLKLERVEGDNTNRLSYFLARSGSNSVMAAVRGWGLEGDDVEEFLRGLWKELVDLKLLVRATLKDPRNNAIRGTNGAYQLDVQRMKIAPHRGVWRCGKCRRSQIRPTPKDACPAWRCGGKLAAEDEDADDYNLRLIDEQFEMIRPREHTAMVPPEEREILERQFRGDGELVNTLVCTPTLELGVDIGALDSVLLRNVPPLPANYWQRVGRAGRRHRMAVNLTYARSRVHDQSYFQDPQKLLQGSVEPPKFNLRNDELVKKHAHSAILAHLRQLARPDSGLSEFDREEIRGIVDAVFPSMVRNYLFDEQGRVRTEVFDVSPLNTVTSKHRERLLGHLRAVFAQGWPDDAKALVSDEQLGALIDGAADRLQDVVRRVRSRLDWSLDQLERLEEERRAKGVLDPDEEALRRRCEWLVKRLKNASKGSNAEGFDIAYTFNVLASEGYLPGYGLETGSVLGMASVSEGGGGGRTFPLPRPASVAVREYVPGNRIYANSYQFTPRTFHFEKLEESLLFQVDPQAQVVSEQGSGEGVSSLSASQLRAVPMCDVELLQSSQISDEEEIRFQLPVMVLGYERGEHGGGEAFTWGGRDVQFRRNVAFRLVNVGAKSMISRQTQLGYPVCLTCGQSRSPFASTAELQNFEKRHRDLQHTQQWAGFYADVTAHALSILECENQEEAYTLAEVIRTAAATVLDMDQEDLQILVIGRPGTERFDAHLYDPMPGGSGLLEQICERFEEVVAKGIEIAEGCPAACDRACIDCLLTFRNAFYHTHLNRRFAADAMPQLGPRLEPRHEIPAKHGKATVSIEDMPVNEAEARLKAMLERASLPDPEWHRKIDLGFPLKFTIPDAFYPTEHSQGLAVYLDGLSRHIHGNPATAKKDAQIREQLRADDYDVIAIPASELGERDAMAAHIARIAQKIEGRERAKRVREDTSWFESEPTAKPGAEVLPFEPTDDDTTHYRTSLPLISLKAAAGSWGSPDPAEVTGWVVPRKPIRISEGMFVAQVVGKSMEPKIPDGSWGVFRYYRAGSRTGKIVLAAHHSIDDPESGGRFTVKKYSSRKTAEGDAWRHVEIKLQPLNPEYEPVIIAADDEDSVRVVAEFIDTL